MAVLKLLLDIVDPLELVHTGRSERRYRRQLASRGAANAKPLRACRRCGRRWQDVTACLECGAPLR